MVEPNENDEFIENELIAMNKDGKSFSFILKQRKDGLPFIDKKGEKVIATFLKKKEVTKQMGKTLRYFKKYDYSFQKIVDDPWLPQLDLIYFKIKDENSEENYIYLSYQTIGEIMVLFNTYTHTNFPTLYSHHEIDFIRPKTMSRLLDYVIEKLEIDKLKNKDVEFIFRRLKQLSDEGYYLAFDED